MATDPDQQVEQAKEEARRQAEHFRAAAREPEQQREAIRQNSVIYGALIAIGLILVQQFLTVTTPVLDWSAKVCVIAFSVAIPLLAALLLVNHQEAFRRRVADSVAVRVTRPVAQVLAFAGLVAGFWHIMWLAGVAILASSFVAMLVHSAGYMRVEWTSRAGRPGRETAAPTEPH